MISKNKKCLYCYEPLLTDETDFHSKCSRKFFRTEKPPRLEFGLKDIEELAIKVLGRSVSVPGVQPKLSIDVEKSADKTSVFRLTIVGLWGKFILKPPFELYPQMPEVEDLTMHLAEIAGIKTAEHTLIRLFSGELAYLSKRFDRINKTKLHVEDMAQLTGTLTERKYKGSMEKVGKTILEFSDYPINDLLIFIEVTLFSFLAGNADMHLKNFSLITSKEGEVMYSPAYDLLSTKILLPKDEEELALTLRGKKRKFTRKDFDAFALELGINKVSLERVYKRFTTAIPQILSFINKSFLSNKLINDYKKLIAERAGRLDLS
jgi:serine/threonine-protein kinase HipA